MSLLPGFLEAGIKLLDRVIPDPEAKAAAQVAMLQAENQFALQEMQTSLSAIVAEAQSSDAWTSRARPTFLYVMYTVILLCVLGGIIGIWFPGQVEIAAVGINKLLLALPEELWWLFGTGYLGYSASRGYEKVAAAKGKRLPFGK